MKSDTVKRIKWILISIVPIYFLLILTAGVGFFGVFLVGLAFVLFVFIFIFLLNYEKSSLWNGIIAFLFWMPLIIIHLLQPGTETIKQGTVYVGVIEILSIACIHSSIQFVLSFLINVIMAKVRRHVKCDKKSSPAG